MLLAHQATEQADVRMKVSCGMPWEVRRLELPVLPL